MGIFKINMLFIQENKIQLKVVTVSLENRKRHLCQSLANNIKDQANVHWQLHTDGIINLLWSNMNQSVFEQLEFIMLSNFQCNARKD